KETTEDPMYYRHARTVDVDELFKIFPPKEPVRRRLPLPLAAYIVLFTIFTGKRPSEARLMRWPELNEDCTIWTIPPHRHKRGPRTGQPLIVPLSSEATKMLRLLRAQQQSDGIETEYVFANGCAMINIGRSRRPDLPPSREIVLKYLRRML